MSIDQDTMDIGRKIGKLEFSLKRPLTQGVTMRHPPNGVLGIPAYLDILKGTAERHFFLRGDTMLQTAPSLVGQTFAGCYHVDTHLAWTRWGEAFTATHPSLDMPLTLRVVPGQLDPAAVIRFQTALRAAGRVDHPAIARTLDAGISPEGWPFIVTERPEGTPLDEILRRLAAQGNVFGPKRAIDLLIAVASALATAHARGVFHLGLSAQSVMVGPEPDRSVKVLDLGLAAAFDRKEDTQQRHLNAASHRMSYTAPELHLGDPGDARSDIYSFGVLAFELLSGRPPKIDRDQDTFRRAYTGPHRTQTIPRGLEPLILRCLESTPARRIDSAAEIFDALRRIASQEQDARGSSSAGGRSRASRPEVPSAHSQPAVTLRGVSPSEQSSPFLTSSADGLAIDDLATTQSTLTRQSDAIEEVIFALRDRGIDDLDKVLDLAGLLQAEDGVVRVESEIAQLHNLVRELEATSSQRIARLQRALMAVENARRRHAPESRSFPAARRLDHEQLTARLDQLSRFISRTRQHTQHQITAMRRQIERRQIKLLRRAGHAAGLRQKLLHGLHAIKPTVLREHPDLDATFAAAGV